MVTTAVFTSYGNHDYTGIFEGAENVIVRLSESDAVNNESVAFKFLRNGAHSANQFGMISV